jgi:hypothetical protein
MRFGKRQSQLDAAPPLKTRCNHPLAVVVDPSEQEIKELESMLARCPNCSKWHPGDGPIMAVLTSRRDFNHNDSNNHTL